MAQKSGSTTESESMETDNDGGAAGAAAAAVSKDDQVSNLQYDASRRDKFKINLASSMACFNRFIVLQG